MFRIHRMVLWLGCLLVLSLACRLPPAKARTFENEMITFTIPAGWQTMDEIWDRPTSPGKEYKGLGVQGIVTIQYPPYQGKGKAFFAVAASPMVSGQDLESRFTQAYLMAVPEIEDETKSMFERGELSGFQITYRRPWGEPWWQFSDIWLERNSVIYVLSFYASPNSFDTYSDTFNQILESIQFKD